jgi:PAS domain S-box-containing protein
MTSCASASVRREIDRMLKLSRELEALKTPGELAALGTVREIVAPPLVWSSLEDGACDYHSQRWLEYTGLYHEQTLGDGWMAALHRGDWEAVKEAWQRSLRTGSTYLMKARYRRYNGQYDWFLTRAEPIRDQTGTIIRWFGSNVNISDSLLRYQTV